jgi:hypothetical protein
MRAMEIFDYLFWRFGILALIFCIYIFYSLISKPFMRDLLGLGWWGWIDSVNDYIRDFLLALNKKE